MFVFDWIRTTPRRVFAAICIICLALLAFGLYLQHVVGLEPCPMCIVQRYAMVLIAFVSGLTALVRGRAGQVVGALIGLLFAGFGGFTAARQSWLQWYPRFWARASPIGRLSGS